jgi:hypothetical protein
MIINSEIQTLSLVTDARSPYHTQFSIGGITVEVAGASPQDVTLVSSLKPFRTHFDRADISIEVEWTADLFPQKKRQLFDSGTTWRCYEEAEDLQFDFNSPVFGTRPYKRLHVDRHFERATLQMNEAAFADFPVQAEPLEYPLDELLIMHRLTQEDAIELHACGIVRSDGVGSLFVGHSGAGKSTTTRLWTERERVEVLSDDRIVLRTSDGRSVNNVRDSSRYTRNDDINYRMRMYGTPWHGEAMYASSGDAPVRAIFILEHGSGNRLTELTPSDAVAELFARSFVPFHRHEYVDAALQFLQEVVASVPCYRYAFEPNPAAVETILSFRD